ncbi:Mitogen-activated protein kinase kinase kinase 5 [Glycine max]|nr:Mitogen-activated protein kinase kinase kinase 5 [Glycine max]
MRWFPTLIFSHSHSHSNSPSSTSSSLSSSSSSSLSSSATLKSSPSTSSASDPTRKNSGSAWFFGSGKRSTWKRSKKLTHVAVLDSLVVPPLSRSSSTFDRSSTSCVQPQPLPLPRDADYRSPSPKDAADRPDAAVDVTLTPGFRMRSVFARQETRSAGVVAEQERSEGDKFWLSVPPRSAPTSPLGSPSNKNDDDLVPYYYVSPKGNQFWSAPEMPTFDSSHPPPAFFDLSALHTDNIPSPHQSPTRLSSLSIPPKLSLDTSIARRETTAPLAVHPLPLPPWAGPGPPLLSPSSTFSPPVAKTESLPMKNQWQKGKLLGRGTFGTVYVATNRYICGSSATFFISIILSSSILSFFEARLKHIVVPHRKTGALCAMKEAEIFSDDPKSAECIKQLEQEIKVLSHLQHPNIVQYYGSEIVEDRFYIYLEYVHPGSMNKYVREHCGAITECVVRNFTRHILSGLAYLHSKKTIHRDIKGANLLVDSAGVVKLADFGMAKHLTGHVADLSLKGSPYWMAPELFQAGVQKDNSSDLAFAVDIWSLGCTIIEMFTGKPPWSEYEGAAAMFKVMKDTPPIPETLSAEGKDFLRLCFIRNPAERPTASMLLQHRFLKNLQQPDVSSSMQLYNGTSLMDIHSPKELSENKLDQISIPSAHIAKGKLATESGIAVPYS